MQNAQEEKRDRKAGQTQVQSSVKPRSRDLPESSAVLVFQQHSANLAPTALGSCLVATFESHSQRRNFPNAQETGLQTHSTYSTSFIEAPADMANYDKHSLMYTQSRTTLASGKAAAQNFMSD